MTTPAVLTIGHSTHSNEQFMALLAAQGVSAVADVRIAPYSRHQPDFNRETLRESLAASGIAYVFLGRELGARPSVTLPCMSMGESNTIASPRQQSFAPGSIVWSRDCGVTAWR